MRRRRGFTLIELMVSIALFGLIAAGAMMLVMSGLRMQAHSARLDVAQSALRAGLDFMTRDLLSASAGMSSGSIMVGTGSLNTISFPVASNTGVNGSDVLDLYMADSSYDFATVYNGVTTSSSSISVDQITPFTPPQLGLLTDLANGVQISITSVSPPAGSPQPMGTLNITAVGAGGFPSATGGSYSGPNAYVFVLRHVRYSIGPCFGAADTTYARQTCLMMDVFDNPGNTTNPQPLAEGVEDLQIAFGYDNDGDGLIQEDTPASTADEWYGNASGDVMPVTLTNLKAVRITIIAISTMNENVKSGSYSRPAAEDHAAGTVDGFFRRTIRSEVTVRNLNI
jgi:prepilin-type N-terminal cleavage/methylation domain-containing protein